MGISSATEPGWNISLLPVKFFSAARPPTAAYAAFAIVHAAFALSQPDQRKVINASWHVSPGGAGLTTLKHALDVAVNTLDCLVVTPVAAHMVFDRSFVLAPSEHVTLEVAGDEPGLLSADGRESLELP